MLRATLSILRRASPPRQAATLLGSRKTYLTRPVSPSRSRNSNRREVVRNAPTTTGVNAGGRYFEVLTATLTERVPSSRLAALVSQHHQRQPPPTASSSKADSRSLLFLDVDADGFSLVLSFLRGLPPQLPTASEVQRLAALHAFRALGLESAAFAGHHNTASDLADASAASPPPISTSELLPPVIARASSTAIVRAEPIADRTALPSDSGAGASLPDIVVVQLCDHMSHEQGVKRHAMTITYGADGFFVRNLVHRCRKDLQRLLSATYWQAHQTNERAAFFITTKMNNASADLLLTSVTQAVLVHTEETGYSLVSSYVTLSPDTVHLSVRVFLHTFIFRRVRQPHPSLLEAADASDQQDAEEADNGDHLDAGGSDAFGGKSPNEHRNFVPPTVGPRAPSDATAAPRLHTDEGEPFPRVVKIWDQ